MLVKAPLQEKRLVLLIELVRALPGRSFYTVNKEVAGHNSDIERGGRSRAEAAD